MNDFFRIIPCLLLSGGGLIKTKRFSSPQYVGDPLNAARIFSAFEADELVLLDISAEQPNFALLRDFASECFMPLCYGGGVRSVEQMETLFRLGIEKVSLNTGLLIPGLLSQAVRAFGSQAVVASIDVRSEPSGYACYVRGGRQRVGTRLEEFLEQVQRAGAGEVLLTNIDREGGRVGYDLDLLTFARKHLSVPLIALGGAGSTEHLAEARTAGADAGAAGSLFVLEGRHRAVLLSYPERRKSRG